MFEISCRVDICLSCLPRDEDICSRYQKLRDTEYSRYRESTVLVKILAKENYFQRKMSVNDYMVKLLSPYR